MMEGFTFPPRSAYPWSHRTLPHMQNRLFPRLSLFPLLPILIPWTADLHADVNSTTPQSEWELQTGASLSVRDACAVHVGRLCMRSMYVHVGPPSVGLSEWKM
ncbi:unnamed protein product [Periconia digitata]|uniref:Uncharacterized protein n=1 Tax=Periconia digitata TaxID=1303443 RepID=A0A9W4UHG5_9PLEO|nr:unnamed protein product [Periconia digitata]